VSEGTALPAWAVDPARSVWLLPTPDFQRAQLEARGTRPGPARLYSALGDVIAAEGAEHGLPTPTVARTADATDTVRRVEALLAGPLRAGPAGTDRPALLREQNAAAIEQVRGYYG